MIDRVSRLLLKTEIKFFISVIIIITVNLFDVKDAVHAEEREEKVGGQGKIAFFCGNPMVEIIKGIIHIYKNK